MIVVPPGWAQAIAPGSMTVNRYVDFRLQAALTDPPDYFGVPVSGGSVTIDTELTDTGGGFHRVSGRLTVVDDDVRFASPDTRLTPLADNTGWTAPYGTIARVMYGVEVPGYTGFFGDNTFFTPYGTVRIGENQDEQDGSLDLNLYDLAKYVSRNQFDVPYVIGPGQNYVTAVVTMVQSRLPANLLTPVQATSTDQVTPMIVIDPTQDPWVEAEAMMASIGFVIYFDLLGQLTIMPRPDPSDDDPVRTFVHGQDAIVALARNLSDDPGYNGVSMRSDSSVLTAPLQSTAWDTNPNSPTYYLGPYGKNPYQTSSPYIATQAQCDAAAVAALPAVLGLTEKIALACLPDPALQVNDVVYVYRQRGPAGVVVVDGNYVIDQITMPLSLTEPMTMQLHRQRTSS